ncbi:O-antigen ligase family protein [Coleofasciculus sp. FACHB-64]|uniref:O-antigen ligase family protein n=1 Tax=Cyanophyceae TaxID=3028117 RepID=UPI001682A331|nr:MULTISPECIES: O-antigen ligase family protein [unclassified Coleofasciculus]MBD1841401.1 O-antigen ligase family protein [Coleofasciculus sp. FACHB-501]MBD2046339.1 O-antigen ligase family protein [Coleofasciculus sp. FACHB-64]MBD2087036.1 O-antigen ligase family protein [Coleofasciculus sp. FACHB-542]
MKPQNLEEKLIWYYITWIYVIHILGLQMTLVPILAWFFLWRVGKKLWNQTENTPTEEKITIPTTIWVWIICILVMEVALIAAHMNFNLGLGKILNSSINWVVRYAPLALFPLAGCLKIRPQIIYRAACILCLQSLIAVIVCYTASRLHLPSHIYTSPLRLIERSGLAYYSVNLYGLDPEGGGVRLELFTPWAPALGMVGNIYFFLAAQESNKKWRFIGMIGAVAMIVGSVSRLGIVSLPFVIFSTWALSNFTKPYIQLIAGIASFIMGVFSSWLINSFRAFSDMFYQARAGSSRVRDILARLAVERWKEAPIWGHGIGEFKGPAVATFKPIGSHNTWFGLLVTKGIVGFTALVIPLAWSFIDLVIKSQSSRVSRVGLSIILVIFMFTFGENIEALAYVYWPGLVMLGISIKEKFPSFLFTETNIPENGYRVKTEL